MSRPAAKALPIVGATLAGLVLLLALAWLVLSHLYPPERLASMLAQQVSATTGREFRIGGKLSLRVFPSLAVVAHDVVLGNAAWGSRPEMLKVEQASFEVALRPLLSGDVHLLGIDVSGVDALLERDGQGRANWIFEPSPAAGPAAAKASNNSGSGGAVRLDRFAVSKAHIAYRDAPASALREVQVDKLELKAHGDTDQLAATLTGAGRTWQLKASTGRYETLASGRADWPFDLQLSSPGASLSAVGVLASAAQAGTVKADVEVHITDPNVLAAFVDPAALPRPIDAKLKLTRSAQVIAVEELQATLSGQALTGNFSVQLDRSPMGITGALSSDSLDFRKLMPAPKAGAPGPAAKPLATGPLFGDQPLPAIALPSLDLHLDLNVGRLALTNAIVLTKLSTTLRSDAQRLRMDPLAFGIADGSLSGRVELAAPAGAPWHVALSLAGQGLSVETLERMAGGSTQLHGGHLRLDTSLNLSGRTARELAASSTGRVFATVNGTAVAGAAASADSNVLLTLVKAILPIKQAGAGKPLAIECAVLNLPLKQGRAAIDRSIALETDQVAVAAVGELDLVAQTVSLKFRPATKKGLGLSAAALSQLVMLEGPLRKPSIGIDLAGTARSAASIGAAVATGGLSLLARRFVGNTSQDTRACEFAAAAH